MKTIFVNDTTDEINPGCHATVYGLQRLLNMGGQAVSLKRGYQYEVFRNCILRTDSLRYQNLRKVKRILQDCLSRDATCPYETPEVNRELWYRAVEILKSDREFNTLLSTSDLVVINMEGTIHHNAIGALALLGIAKVAKEQQKEVWLVNGTVQAVDIALIQEVFSLVDYVAVREPYSYRWLKELGINATQAADCAFLADYENIMKGHSLDTNSNRVCLYTPGVLSLRPFLGKRNIISILRHLWILRKVGFAPVFLRIDEAEWIDGFLSKFDIPTVWVGDLEWRSLPSYLKQFSVIVSGRYHILIFAMMAGIPVIPLSSNSWKIEGFLELAGLCTPIVKKANDLQKSLEWLRCGERDYDRLSALRAMALDNVPVDYRD